MKELINAFGTSCIHRTFADVGTIGNDESLPLTLDRVLVPAEVQVVGDDDASTFSVHVRGDADTQTIWDVGDRLTDLDLSADPALAAYLSLPWVDASADDLLGQFQRNYVGHFRDVEEALASICAVDERERDVSDYAAERHIFVDSVWVDYEALRVEASEDYEFVEHLGRTYVFTR